ncbi:MAG: phage integrase protein breaking and rejoining enzyme [Bryobacterales bacterium]|nr:phage integrase protein breaking and rejoining enzyme [Bryobacterales bacterium]
MRRTVPSGRIFRQAYRDRHGKRRLTRVWYLKYYVKGKPVVVSSKTEDKTAAITQLTQRVAEASRNSQTVGLHERIRMDQLFDLLLAWYRLKERRSTYDVERKIEKHLRPWFGKLKPQAVGDAERTRYIQFRRAQKRPPTNATINRELAYVRRAMKLGAQHDPPLVLHVPRFEMLPEADAREGTLSHDQYRAVRDLLPNYARVALVVAYHTGARKGELCQIRKDRIDLKARRIELPGRTTKTKRPRFLPIYGDMGPELDMAISSGNKGCPFLIQRDGEPVKDWEKAWVTACKAAGLPGTLFHDLRRTALTHMIEAGLSEKEAMEISGHRTRSVFDRYHIVSERRLREMAEKLEVHLKTKEKPLRRIDPTMVH